ncbi:MAG TPA: Gfo/Idh/MocA family oxidoreductase [Burkholderiales bacterium]|jgi:predicted dehydrogenase
MPVPVRLGLAGAGRWGRNYLRTAARLEGVQLASVASRNPDTAASVPPGCRVVGDWRELLDPSALDGLIIATPPATHAEIARAALAKGISVLIEKPLALSAGDAASILAAARASAAHAWVEHTHLFSPSFRALKELAARYGGVREIRGEAGNFGPYREDVPVLWDWGPHDVAMCLDLLGERPASAACTAIERGENRQETISVALSFPSGVPASILLSNAREKVRRFSVRCAQATLLYDDLAADKLTVDGRPVAVAAELPLAVAVREFAAALAQPAKDYRSLELGVAVVEVLAACE